jgi:hypothetical protein
MEMRPDVKNSSEESYGAGVPPAHVSRGGRTKTPDVIFKQSDTGSDPQTPFAILVCFFVGANLLIFPLLNSGNRNGDFFAMLSVSVLSAQLCLVAVWGVFGTAPFVRRLARCAALGFGAYVSLMFGMAFALGNQAAVSWDEFTTLAGGIVWRRLLSRRDRYRRFG